MNIIDFHPFIALLSSELWGWERTSEYVNFQPEQSKYTMFIKNKLVQEILKNSATF